MKNLKILILKVKTPYGTSKDEAYLVDESNSELVFKQFKEKEPFLEFTYFNIENGLDDIRAVVRKSSSVDHIEFRAATEKGMN